MWIQIQDKLEIVSVTKLEVVNMDGEGVSEIRSNGEILGTYTEGRAQDIFDEIVGKLKADPSIRAWGQGEYYMNRNDFYEMPKNDVKKAKKKKLFISQPMRGLTKEEILAKRKDIKRTAEAFLYGESLELIDSYFEEYPKVEGKGIPVYYLGKSIQAMAHADYVYFGGDWRDARGCQIEYEVAKQYGLEIIMEEI